MTFIYQEKLTSGSNLVKAVKIFLLLLKLMDFLINSLFIVPLRKEHQ